MTSLSPGLDSLVCLIGAAGVGKSTWASTWPDTQVLELDRFRALVSDDAGCQEATDDAVFALQAVLEARLARRKMTVVNATNCEQAIRANLIATARRHGVPTVALVIPTPAYVCVERQEGRPANRRVPEPVVLAQHTAMATAFSGLPGDDPDVRCTVHGSPEDEDQEDDPEGRADLEEWYRDAVRA
ncbi:AAA family ATPase [Streptomyces mirabilis]